VFVSTDHPRMSNESSRLRIGHQRHSSGWDFYHVLALQPPKKGTPRMRCARGTEVRCWPSSLCHRLRRAAHGGTPGSCAPCSAHPARYTRSVRHRAARPRVSPRRGYAATRQPRPAPRAATCRLRSDDAPGFPAVV